MKYDDRKELLIQAAMMAAQQIGYPMVTRAVVAHRAEVSESLVQYHFNTMGELRSAIVERAIEDENLHILAQAIVMGHRGAKEAPEQLKSKAIDSLKLAEVLP